MISKKRNRTSIVCTFCKKRKTKCDKGQPCGTCIKYGNNECIYEPVGLNADVKQQRRKEVITNEMRLLENKMLKLKKELIETENKPNFDPGQHFPYEDVFGKCPIAEFEDKIRFSDDRSNMPLLDSAAMTRSPSPLNWFSLIKIDGSLPFLMRYICDVYPDGKTRENEAGCPEVRGATKRSPVKLSYISSGPNNLNFDELRDRIKAVLPTKKVIWSSLNAFFNRYYEVGPVIDQTEFTNAIIEIIGPESFESEPVDVKVTSKLDLINLGILLMLLRLTYLTICFTTSPLSSAKAFLLFKFPDQEIEFLYHSPIGTAAFELAKECLGLFDLFTVTNMQVFQLALLVRLYYLTAPEEGDGDHEHESSTFNSVLTNMALCLGLNRDPDIVFNHSLPSRTKNLRRTLWFLTYAVNVNVSFTHGNRLTIRETDFDTKPPVPEAAESCINNTKLYLEWSRASKSKYSIFPLLIKICDYVSTIGSEVEMRLLSSTLEQLELKVIQGYGFMYNKIKTNDFESSRVKLVEIKMHVYTTITSASLLFYFYNYYEKKKNKQLVVFYLKKIVVIVCYEILPFYFELLTNATEIFQGTGSFMALPDILIGLHRAGIILMSLFLKCRIELHQFTSAVEAGGFQDQTHEEHFHYLRMVSQCTQKFSKIIRVVIDTLTELSPKYFYAWKASRTLKKILDNASRTEVFEVESFKSMKPFVFCSDTINDMHSILTVCDNKISAIRKGKVPESTTVDDVIIYKDGNVVEPAAEPRFEYVFGPNGEKPELTRSWGESSASASTVSTESDIDKLWVDMLVSKPDLIKNDYDAGFLAIANYNNSDFVDNSRGLTTTGFDTIFKAYL